MKAERHAQILNIIAQEPIETQEELAEALRRNNINVTQATVSRDIKELRLVKVLSEEGTYRYASVSPADKVVTERFIRMFSDSVTSVQCANNLIVIKTLSGTANAAAGIIDSLNHPDILGCIAGDDTILVIARSNETVHNVMHSLKELQK